VIAAAASAEATGKDRVRQEKEAEMAEGVSLEDQAAAAREFMEGLMEAFGYDASVETRELDEETIEVAANGAELGLLVGPRGSTLAALQDVTRTVVQHRFPTRTDRIVVDVAGYRQRRVAALQRFTRQIAGEVLETGTDRALEPMSPADRKVIHDTVHEIDGLVTRSEGEDAARHVVIAPEG
jgi:spoIIIJ-associated protein